MMTDKDILLAILSELKEIRQLFVMPARIDPLTKSRPEMTALIKQGWTYGEVAVKFRTSRQRVFQIVKS